MSSQHPDAPELKRTGTDEPLPPIPDGGLARAMPDWLRDAPAPTASPPALTSGDPAGFITADDLPDWLRSLGAGGTAPSPVRSESPAAPAVVQPRSTPSPGRTTDQASLPPPRPAPTPAAIPSPPARPEPDRRALIGVLGFVVLALGVLAYLYARGVI